MPERDDEGFSGFIAATVLAELEATGWRVVRADEAPADDFGSARVLSVYGPFHSRTLVDMPTEVAQRLFPEGLAAAAPSQIIDAALGDVEAIRAADSELAESSLAALLVEMAMLLAHPYNSATSKAACAAQMQACRDRLWELLPDGEEDEDELDRILARLQTGEDGTTN